MQIKFKKNILQENYTKGPKLSFFSLSENVLRTGKAVLK